MAPPTASPPVAQGSAEPWPVTIPRRSHAGAIAIGTISVLVLLGALAAHLLGSKAPSGHPAASPLAMAAGPVEDGNSGGGIFKVEKQAEQAPVIAITDSSPDDLRLTLQDAKGQVQTEVISAGVSREITVPQGSYSATIDAPNNEMILPSTGEVDVKEFHHYSAIFGEVPQGETDRTFYIGD